MDQCRQTVPPKNPQPERLAVIEEVDDTLQNTTVEDGKLMAIDITTPPVMNRSVMDHIQPTDLMGENNTEKSRDPISHRGETKNKLFSDKQKDDASLLKCFDKTKQEDFHKAKTGKWQFFIKDHIFRYFARTIRSIKQLVIPSKYRTEVLKTRHDSISARHLGTIKTLA